MVLAGAFLVFHFPSFFLANAGGYMQGTRVGLDWCSSSRVSSSAAQGRPVGTRNMRDSHTHVVDTDSHTDLTTIVEVVYLCMLGFQGDRGERGFRCVMATASEQTRVLALLTTVAGGAEGGRKRGRGGP